MPIEFHYMTDEHLGQFIPRSIELYAQAMVDAKEYSTLDIPRTLAKNEVMGYFPNGILRANEHIFHIHHTGLKKFIGILWVSLYLHLEEPMAFLAWIEVFPDYRRQGFAKQALKQLEGMLAEVNISRIELNVFAHNTQALTLYQELGYYIQQENIRGKAKRTSRIDMVKEF